MSRTQLINAPSRLDGRQHSNRIDQVRQSWSKTETERRRNRAVVLQMALLSKLFPEKKEEPKVGSYISFV